MATPRQSTVSTRASRAGVYGNYGFFEVIEGFTGVALFIASTIEDRAEDYASLPEGLARATYSYNDDTGATRAGTVGYAESGRSDSGRPAEIEMSRAFSEQYRAGSADQEDPPAPPYGEVWIVVMSSTDYSLDLNTKYGAEAAYLSEAIESTCYDIYDRIASELASYFT